MSKIDDSGPEKGPGSANMRLLAGISSMQVACRDMDVIQSEYKSTHQVKVAGKHVNTRIQGYITRYLFVRCSEPSSSLHTRYGKEKQIKTGAISSTCAN